MILKLKRSWTFNGQFYGPGDVDTKDLPKDFPLERVAELEGIPLPKPPKGK